MSSSRGILEYLTDQKKRLLVARYILLGWGIVNIPLGVWTGLGLALPSTLPLLQFQVSSIYETMLAAIYIPMGACAILAASDPVRHKLLIIFIIISSFAHGGIMTYHAFTTHLHLWPGLTWGSVTLIATGVAFLIFYPRGVLKSS